MSPPEPPPPPPSGARLDSLVVQEGFFQLCSTCPQRLAERASTVVSTLGHSAVQQQGFQGASKLIQLYVSEAAVPVKLMVPMA